MKGKRHSTERGGRKAKGPTTMKGGGNRGAGPTTMKKGRSSKRGRMKY